jgi:predicted AAA+ superfamily ATPase
MNKETLKKVILDGQETYSAKQVISREHSLVWEEIKRLDKVLAIVGPRRAGKTYFLFQIMRELGLKQPDVVFLDFSEIPLRDFTAQHFEVVLQAYLELHPEGKPWFFFDEIQEIGGFEAGLKFLLNRGYKVFVTGSTSRLFAADLASALRGKTLSATVLPLNFREFLLFRNKPLEVPDSRHRLAEMNNLVREYLHWGGFPEVVLVDSTDMKDNLIRSYIDSMLFRDVIERHAIKNINLVESVFIRLLRSFTKEISVHRWYNDFKSMGVKVSKDTLYQYLRYFEDAQFVFLAENLLKGGRSRKKVYLVDNGLYLRVRGFEQDWGKLLENRVFNDLRGKYDPVSFVKGQGWDLDFVAGDMAVQVSYQLNEQSLPREVEGASRGLELPSVQRNMVVVQEEVDPTVDTPGATVLPYWRAAIEGLL